MPRRPNLIVTIADDQRHDTIRALGNGHIITPTFERMCQRGLGFTNAHHMGSTVPHVCAPSRAMLLTGRTLFHLPNSLINSVEESGPEPPFLPEILRQNGYHTHGIGKWHNGKASFARSFDGGANIFFGGMCDHDSVPVHDFDPTGTYSPESARIADGFSTDVFANSALEFLDNYDGEEPFFLFVAFTAPHDPRTPLPAYAALYPPDQIPVPGNFLPAHPFDNGELGIRDELLEAFPRTPEAVQNHLADYYAMITHLDHAIGNIHRRLEERGLAENTIVIHTADHGLAIGQHGLMGKQNLYEHSIRVPLLLCGPGIPAGESRDGLCYQHDLFPTICEAAKIPVPNTNEFKSLWPKIEDADAPSRVTLFCIYRDCQYMIKTRRWKMIRYSVNGENLTQLFDLEQDPLELRDLSALPAHQDILSCLEAALVQWRSSLDDPNPQQQLNI